jgi:hypothetical protein
MKIDNSTKDLALKAGIALGAYFFVVRPILQKLGLQKTAQQEQQEKQSEKARIDYIEETLRKPDSKQFNKGKPYFAEGQYSIIADQIFEDLNYSFLDQNKLDAYKQMLKMRNDGDIALLMKYWGIRQLKKFGLNSGNPVNLSQALTKELTKEQLKQLRDWFKSNKLKYTL